jgi:WD40 repeat protein
MKSNLTFCIFAIVLFSASCNQDSIVEPENCLKNYLTSDTLVDVIVELNCPSTVFPNYPDSHAIAYIAYNPTNENTLAFVVGNFQLTTPPSQELYVFDACSGVMTKVSGNLYVTEMDWSADGWIYFTGGNSADFGVWKVRPNGSQLQLIIPGVGGDIVCSPDGSQLIYTSEFLATSSGVLESHLGAFTSASRFSWLPNGYAAVDGNNLLRFDSTIINSEPIDQIIGGGFFEWPQSSIFDMVNQRLYWITNNILAYNQFPSNQRTEFDNALSSRDYLSVDVSGDGETVAFTRVDRVMIDDCHQDVYIRAYVISKDGGQVYRLNIPF